MINNIANAKALKAALKNTPSKVKVAVPTPGTFCKASFCAGEATTFVDENALCPMHARIWAAVN